MELLNPVVGSLGCNKLIIMMTWGQSISLSGTAVEKTEICWDIPGTKRSGEIEILQRKD